MSQISSINFKKSNAIQTRHNDRDLPPNYLISDIGCEVNHKHKEALRLKNQIIENAINTYNANKSSKAPNFKAKSYEWSAVVNIKETTTMADLERLAEHFEQKYGFQCYQIAIHRDEGHINDNGEKEINHHAHLEFITLDKNTGKSMFRAELQRPKALRQIQTEVAEILQMERGQDKRISGAKRIEPRIYAEMKEKERANTRALKAELDNTKAELTQAQETIKKLSANAIKKRVEQERKAWLNTNKALHEQGAEPIFTAEHYKELRELNKGAFTSLDELENALKELEKRIRKEKKQHQSNKPQLSTTKKDFKSRLIDEFYSDLSTKHDLTPFYFNKELKTLENKQKGYKIKDSENTLTLTTSKKADLSEQVALMLDMAKSKGWELETIEVSGSKAFCDEVARQIAEIKAKEKAEQERKLKELEKENERLKAELANNRTETALKSPNEPNPSQDITQSEKTQENAPKAKSQAQKDLELVKSYENNYNFSNNDCYDLKDLAKRYNLDNISKSLTKHLENNRNLDKLTYSIPKPQELQEIKGFLEKLTAQEQEPSKTTITQKVNFNTKSQNQDKSRNF